MCCQRVHYLLRLSIITDEKIFDNFNLFSLLVTHLKKFKCCTFYISRIFVVGDDGNILIVAHGPALDACTRQLRGLPPRTAPQLGKILHKVHYCNIIRSYPNETSWKIAESPSPSFTNMGNPTFNWKVLLE